MRSDSVQDAARIIESPGDVHRVLDAAFGFFVWAGHLIVIYVANAVTCALGITSGNPHAESTLVVALAVFTIVAAAIVGAHGLRRYRERSEARNHAFLLSLAVGDDAAAAFAILWQLIPIFMAPVCR